MNTLRNDTKLSNIQNVQKLFRVEALHSLGNYEIIDGNEVFKQKLAFVKCDLKSSLLDSRSNWKVDLCFPSILSYFYFGA